MNRPSSRTRAEISGAVLTLSPPGTARVVAPPVVRSHLLNAVTADGSGVWAAGNAGRCALAARWNPDRDTWSVLPEPPLEEAIAGVSVQGVAVPRDESRTLVVVGAGYDREAGAERPLLLRWDGAAWSVPGDLPLGRVLTGVALDGATGWAVGHGCARGDADGPVALRLEGAEWTPVDLPPVPRGRLLAVAATAPDDVWAVGAADRSGLVLHHDGRTWRTVSCPPSRFPLTGVAAVSPTDAWAVGRDMVLHWDGRHWSEVRAPVTSANTVTVDAAGRPWVAGGRGELVRRDGDRWTVVPPPGPFGAAAVWLASAAIGSGVCLVGTRRMAGSTPMGGATAAEHTRRN